jgi:hypothetical protein
MGAARVMEGLALLRGNGDAHNFSNPKWDPHD